MLHDAGKDGKSPGQQASQWEIVALTWAVYKILSLAAYFCDPKMEVRVFSKHWPLSFNTHDAAHQMSL